MYIHVYISQSTDGRWLCWVTLLCLPCKLWNWVFEIKCLQFLSSTGSSNKELMMNFVLNLVSLLQRHDTMAHTQCFEWPRHFKSRWIFQEDWAILKTCHEYHSQKCGENLSASEGRQTVRGWSMIYWSVYGRTFGKSNWICGAWRVGFFISTMHSVIKLSSFVSFFCTSYLLDLDSHLSPKMKIQLKGCYLIPLLKSRAYCRSSTHLWKTTSRPNFESGTNVGPVYCCERWLFQRKWY